jgi:hypothetical protein
MTASKTAPQMTLHRMARVLDAGYCIAKRDPALLRVVDGGNGLAQRAEHLDAAYMLFDPSDDAQGYLLLADDLTNLIDDAYKYLLDAGRINA